MAGYLPAYSPGCSPADDQRRPRPHHPHAQRRVAALADGVCRCGALSRTSGLVAEPYMHALPVCLAQALRGVRCQLPCWAAARPKPFGGPLHLAHCSLQSLCRPHSGTSSAPGRCSGHLRAGAAGQGWHLAHAGVGPCRRCCCHCSSSSVSGVGPSSSHHTPAPHAAADPKEGASRAAAAGRQGRRACALHGTAWG